MMFTIGCTSKSSTTVSTTDRERNKVTVLPIWTAARFLSLAPTD